jgi:hypothetical protein
MTKIFQTLISLLAIYVIFLFYPKLINACCSTSQCPSGYECVGAACPDTQGSCAYGCTAPPCDPPPASPTPGGGGGWTCFPAGTDVTMEDGAKRDIEDVKIGEKVMSQDEKGQKSVSTVTGYDRPIRDEMCQINFTNGQTLRLTSEHPLFTDGGWKAIDPVKSKDDTPYLPVTLLEKGDVVPREDGITAEVDYYACWSERQQTYNLELDGGVNTYFAEGFLAHNKGAQACHEGQDFVPYVPYQYLCTQSVGGCVWRGDDIGGEAGVVVDGTLCLDNNTRPIQCLLGYCVWPCTTGTWTNGACGVSGCTSSQRYQTRTVSPAGCAISSRCVADASCVPTATPKPPTATPAPTLPPLCTVSSWSNAGCGGGSCDGTLMYQTRTVNPAGCTYTTRCAEDASCEPTAAPGCTVGSWTNQNCGGGTCSSDLMYQTRTVDPPGCDTSSRCAASSSCSPTDSPTCNATAVMTPSSKILDVGGSAAFTLTVSDNPAGCVSNVLFVRSSTDVSFSGTNPDNSTPYTINVECDSAGTASVTGRARTGTNFVTSDTATVTCNALPTFTPTPTPIECNYKLSDIVLNGTGDTDTGRVFDIVPAGCPISRVDFVAADPSIASLTSPDTSGPSFTTFAEALKIGGTQYFATVYVTGGITKTISGLLAVNNPKAWCQTKEGDIVAKNSVSCIIPDVCYLDAICDPYLITKDAGAFPGVVMYGNNLNPSNQASDPENWKVKNIYGGTTYGYNYFDGKTSSVSFGTANAGLTGATDTEGYTWLKSSGNFAISADVDLGDRKVILFVPGNLTISSKINLNDGSGFFMAVVGGEIHVEPSVHDSSAPDTPELEGLFVSTGNFRTSSLGDRLDHQLHLRGSVVAGGFSLDRDLDDNSYIPAEFFEFAPDLVLQLPGRLSRTQVIWREVAP